MKIQSNAFEHGDNIPIRYTCDGKNINPPLQFIDIPPKAKSLVLIVDDPDVTDEVFTHWLVWNITPTTKSFSEGKISAGSIEGTTSFGKPGYWGAMPVVW